MHTAHFSFLVLHGGYSTVTVALCNHTTIQNTAQDIIIDAISIPHKQASRAILQATDLLFTRNNSTLYECAFVAAHQGPGPFTTLRSVLATANGLGFATSLPLVGVDGLDAFINQEKNKHTTRYLSCMLNAFCDDVYFALYDQETTTLAKGCEAILEHVARLKDLKETITLMGNGVTLHEELIKKELQDQAVIPATIVDLATVDSIAQIASRHWQNGVHSTQLLPLYLKDSSAKYSIQVA